MLQHHAHMSTPTCYKTQAYSQSTHLFAIRINANSITSANSKSVKPSLQASITQAS